MGGDNDDSNERDDITALEDISGFEHANDDDSDLDEQFQSFSAQDSDTEEIENEEPEDEAFEGTHADFNTTGIFDNETLDQEGEETAAELTEETAETHEFTAEDVNTNEHEDTDATELYVEAEPSADEVTELVTPVENIEGMTEETLAVASHETPKENFDDVQEFAQNLVHGKIQTGANPPYSVLLTEIHYEEDALEILHILQELGLADGHQEKIYRESLERGCLLVSQISEYAAIFLAHKLRRFQAKMRVGLSHVLHAPQNYDAQDFKLQTKETLFHNKQEQKDMRRTKGHTHLLHSTLEGLPGHVIKQHLGVLHKEQTFLKKEIQDQDLQVCYDELLKKLDAEARAQGANALLAIRYEVLPLDDQQSITLQVIGNMVVVSKTQEPALER